MLIAAKPIVAQEKSTLRATPECRNFGLVAKQGNNAQAIERLAKAWRGVKGHCDWPAR
jgi:hypothetical protein